MTSPEEKAVVDRALPRRGPRMSREEREEWGQEEAPRPLLNLGMCSGVGKQGVMKNGVLCCPVCGDPISEGCGSSRFKKEEA